MYLQQVVAGLPLASRDIQPVKLRHNRAIGGKQMGEKGERVIHGFVDLPDGKQGQRLAVVAEAGAEQGNGRSHRHRHLQRLLGLGIGVGNGRCCQPILHHRGQIPLIQQQRLPLLAGEGRGGGQSGQQLVLQQRVERLLRVDEVEGTAVWHHKTPLPIHPARHHVVGVQPRFNGCRRQIGQGGLMQHHVGRRCCRVEQPRHLVEPHRVANLPQRGLIPEPGKRLRVLLKPRSHQIGGTDGVQTR